MAYALAGAVSEFMSQEVQSVQADTSLLDIAELFVKSKFRRFPVLADGGIVGIIIRNDCAYGYAKSGLRVLSVQRKLQHVQFSQTIVSPIVTQ